MIVQVPTLTIAQDRAADELLGRDPLALLIGMLLDQHMRQRSSCTLAEATPELCPPRACVRPPG
jgi:hypothetical protein